MDKSTCSAEGCANGPKVKGLCYGHYNRVRRGDPLLKACRACGKDYLKQGAYCSAGCRPSCAIEWCEAKVNGQEHCNDHARHIKETGKLPTRQWASERLCVVCGKRDWEPNGLRKYCGQACAKVHRLNEFQPVLTAKPCARCGDPIDLLERSQKGYKRRGSAFICAACKRARRSTRHKVSAHVLRRRDGDACGLCGDVIDFTLSHPDPRSPSVDHVHPFSLGGTHDAENLQLAHLRCNVIKSNRPGFVM